MHRRRARRPTRIISAISRSRLPLGAGAKELGLRPSIYVQMGSVFDVKSPVLNVYPKGTDANGNSIVLPITSPILDANGKQQFLLTDTTAATTTVVPVCPATTATTTCTLYANSYGPYLEQYLGNSAKPRLSVGSGSTGTRRSDRCASISPRRS